MGDYAVKRMDELEPVFEGIVRRARASLGARSFGMQVLDLPPSWDGYPNHDHVHAPDGTDGQEEIYVPLSGSATLRVGGEEHELSPGTIARVGPGEKRQLVPGSEGVRVLAIGGVPGSAYKPPEWTEAGGPEPPPPA
jgi:mannose-6-phosphate isomerase-like protein (cupin superfamily)